MANFFLRFLESKIKRNFLKLKQLTLNNKIFFLPPNITGNSKTIISELWMLDLFKNFIPVEDGTFVDVGANIGQTLLKLRAIGNMPYVGFEPNVNCAFYLNQLIICNDFKNANIIPVGISNSNSLLTLHSYSDDFDSSATLLKNFRSTPVKKKWIVPVYDVETIVKTVKLENVSILKIDVEGSEFEVLKSFEKLIKENSPLIMIEILPVYNKQNKKRLDRQTELEKLLKSMKYIIYRIDKTEDEVIKLVEIQEFGIHSNLNKCDYLLVSSNETSKIVLK